MAEIQLAALKSEEVVLQQAAIAALGEIGAVDTIDNILAFIQSEDWLVRQRLAESLGNMPSDKSRSALRYLAKDGNANVIEAAQLSLQRLNPT